MTDIADATRPVRVQRKRSKGWKMSDNTVSVTRPGEFGNPFTLGEAREYHEMFGQPDNGETPEQTAVRWYREWLNGEPVDLDARPPSHERIALLRGKNLACFCALDQPCHADVLLELANTPLTTPDR